MTLNTPPNPEKGGAGQEELNKEEKRKQTWIEVVSEYLKKEIFTKVQKKLERLKERAGRAVHIANQAVLNLPTEVKGDAHRTLEHISKELKESEKELKTLDQHANIPVLERRIKELRLQQKRLQERIKELEEKADRTPEELTEKDTRERQKRELKEKEASHYLKELYKDEKDLSPELKGQKKDILELIAGKTQATDTPSILKFEKTDLDETEGNCLYSQLRKFYEGVSEHRKEKEKEKQFLEVDERTKVSEFKRQIEKEKERYRRTAEIRSIKDKLRNKEYLSPNTQARYIDLVEESLRDLHGLKYDLNFDEDAAIIKLAKEHKVDERFTELQAQLNLLKEHRDEMQKELQTITRVPQRKEIIAKFGKQLNDLVNGSHIDLAPTTPANKTAEAPVQKKSAKELADLIDNTNYQKQIEIRMETEPEGDIKEFVMGLEELGKMGMKEYEYERKQEREGPLKQRGEYARAFAKKRIMEKFADVEKVRALYGERYSKNFNTQLTFDERKQFISELLREINEKYNINAEGTTITANMDGKVTETGAHDRTSPDYAGISDTEVLANKKLAKQIYGEITTQLQQVIEIEPKNYELINAVESKTDPTKRDEIERSLKIDLTIARLKSVYGKDASKLVSITQLETSLKSSQDINLKETLLQTKLDSDFQELKDPLEKSLKELFAVGKYEMISTPNGIAIAFKDHETLSKVLLGEDVKSETVAATLKNCETFKQVAGKIKGAEGWNGNVMVVSTESGELELMHEVQHAIMKELNPKTGTPDVQLKSAVEELSINLATGHVWAEIARQKELHLPSPTKLSLTALTYITPETQGISDENKKKLHTILEMSKELISKEIQFGGKDNLNPMAENMSGTVIADILTSCIDAEGNIDLDQAIAEIKKAFSDPDDQKKYQYNLSSFDHVDLSTPINEKEYFGFEKHEEVPKELVSQLKSNYAGLYDNAGFDFAVVDPMDTRGRANITYDAYMDGKIGVERGKDSVAGLPSAEIPILGPLLVNPIYKMLGKNPDAGPQEYHVGDSSPLSYATRGRAFGGFLRAFRDKTPLLSPILQKMIPENRVKFSAPAKMFNDFPPFGRAHELIIKDLFPAFDTLMKQKFPGRPSMYEATTPNATEIWDKSIPIIYSNLGQDGIKLSQEQAQRIMGELPGMTYEFESGRLKFEPSKGDFDKIDEDGKHRGRIKKASEYQNPNRSFINNISHKDFKLKVVDDDDLGPRPFGLGGDRDNWEKGKKKNSKNAKLNSDVVTLANTMAEAYDFENYAYTMNDLITASHLAHDLAINPMTKSVRNGYYQKDQPDAGPMVLKEGRMVGEHIWYDVNNPAKRGVVIKGKMFELDTAHEMIRRYNLFHIKDALEYGLPDISKYEQENEYVPDNSPESRLRDSKGEWICREDINLEHPDNDTKLYIDFFGNRGFAVKSNEYAWYRDEATNKHYLCKAKVREVLGPDGKILRLDNGNADLRPVRNKFYNSTPYAQNIQGIRGSQKLAHAWVFKASADMESQYDAFGKQFAFLDAYVQRVAEVNRYERKAYYAKTFWEDFKNWGQRIGNVVMIGSLIAAAFTASPIFAAAFLVTMGIQIPFVEVAQYKQKLFGNRRMMALELQQKLGSQMGMYEKIMKGEMLSRLELSYFQSVQSENEAKMEGLGSAKIPDGSAPKDDMAHSFASMLFGEKGALASAFH